MDCIRKGWFSEKSELWPGQVMSLEVEQVLHSEKSKYQDILLFESKTYGRVLVLDGIIQCTERDEFAYQELITHIPLCAHPNPKTVLVVGGGDGGVLREISKHPDVDEIHLCEIDERVIALSKEFLPSMSVGFSDPRVQIHIQDGAKFMEDHKGRFDVIITDSSDPVGPAKCLFEIPYYRRMKSALKPNGIICTQGECLWLDLALIKEVMAGARSIYPEVRYAYTTIPTYPSGQIGFIVASTNESANVSTPVRRLSSSQVDKMGLHYYDSDVHQAAFVLPQFAKKALGLVQQNGIQNGLQNGLQNGVQ